ncbi:MAG: hypothetical protein HY000_41095 [Planctomycetes bacterium]|nr:hypothetical protein [Planctomycetota bacterium]
MKNVPVRNFGLLIAYVLPGFVALFGASYLSDTVAAWLGASPTGGLLYGLLASIAAGLAANAVRWAIVDSVHHRTGLPPPAWDFSKLQDKLAAFETLGEVHYRYYQFYGNAFVAIVFVYVARQVTTGTWPTVWSWPDWGFLLFGILFWATSRDALRKYYLRVAGLLGTRKENAMANGAIHKKDSSKATMGKKLDKRLANKAVAHDRVKSAPRK